MFNIRAQVCVLVLFVVRIYLNTFCVFRTVRQDQRTKEMDDKHTVRFSFDLETQRTRVSSDWVSEHFHLTSCFDFGFSSEQDSVHS